MYAGLCIMKSDVVEHPGTFTILFPACYLFEHFNYFIKMYEMQQHWYISP